MKKHYYFALPFSLIGVVFIILGIAKENPDQMRYGFVWLGIGVLFIIYHKIKKK